MHLPDGHGLALLQRMRAEGFLCDVIAVTAARDVEVVKRAVSQGVVLYLLKPFTYAGFRTKLDQYADYRGRLTAGEGDVGQDDVDQMLGTLRTTPAAHAVPKGMSVDTLREVTVALRDGVGRPRPSWRRTSAPRGSPPAATWSTWPPSSVVERTVRYGGSGRPEVEYRWTGA